MFYTVDFKGMKGKLKSNENIETNPVQCAICHYRVNKKSQKKVLECGHVYHQKCIWSWLVKSGTCPMCRAKVDQYPSYGCAYNEHEFFIKALASKNQV